MATTACNSGKEASLNPDVSPVGVATTEKNVVQVEENNIKIVSSEADFDIYNTLPELEAKSPIVVRAKFTGERKINEYKGAQGETAYTNSISTIEVQKVLKGNIGEETTIHIFEPGYLKGDVYSNVEGYNLLNEKGDYILFLRKDVNKDAYTVVGMYQGKYDLNAPAQVSSAESKTSIDKEYLGENVTQFNNLKAEVLAKYSK